MTTNEETEASNQDEDDPNDPRHPDHDLSEAAPLWLDPASTQPWFTRRGVIIAVAILVILGLLLPSLNVLF